MMTNVLSSQSYTCKVSSTLNRNAKEYGKKFMFDGLDDTCWNSDQADQTSPHCTFLSVPSDNVHPDLLALLCPGANFDEVCDIVIISLESTCVFLCPLVSAESERRVFQLDTTAQAVLYVTLAGEDNSQLLLFSADNCLTTVEAESGRLKRTEHHCLRSQVVCQVSPDSFYLADFFGSSSFTLGAKPHPLSIKGSTCAHFLDELQALVLTLHGLIYLVDLSVPPPQAAAADDPAKLLKQLEKVNEEIRQTERALKDENIRLGEVSMVRSAEQLRDSFRLQVRVHDTTRPGTYILDTLVLNNSRHVFLEDRWNLLVGVAGKSSQQEFSQRLTKSLGPGEAVKVVAEFQIGHLDLPVKVTCRFLKQLTVPSSTDLNSIELPSGVASLQVGSTDLDFTHFITPVSVEPVQEYRDTLPEENHPQDAKVHTSAWETDSDFETICRTLSRNCSHRALGAVRSEDRAAFRLGGSRVELKMNEDRLLVSSTDFPLVFDVLAHLQAKLGATDAKSAEVEVDPAFFVQADNVGLALDYAMLTNTYTPDLEADLQEQLRKLGVPQWVDFEFPEPTTIRQILIQFQGGFVGQDCSIQVGDPLENAESFYPDDINNPQTFNLTTPINAKRVRLVFPKSSDFFGRIIIYNLQLLS